MTGLATQPLEEELQTLQRDVQRMLGRCLLRLQQYEKLMKAIVAHHEISAPTVVSINTSSNCEAGPTRTISQPLQDAARIHLAST